jgi:small subunit ribosomal protein S8
MSDPIADMLTRIRNAYSVGHPKVTMPASKMKLAIANVLKQEGYLGDVFEKKNTNAGNSLEVILRYPSLKASVLHEIRRISNPGRRVYVGKQEIKNFKGGAGISIVSTSHGIMTGKKAKALGVGGEMLCTVW